MPNPTVTRKQFIAAIGAGIAAEPRLTEVERDRLRQVATEAKCFGVTFDDGCPADLANVYNPGEQYRAGRYGSIGVYFAMDFDRALILDLGRGLGSGYWTVSD